MKTTLLPALTLFVTSFALVAQEPKGPPPGGAGQKGQGQKGPPAQKGGQSGQGGQGGQGGEGFRPPQHPLELALDANNDGVIDAKELANAALMLKRLDKNGDGRLTEDEFRPTRPGGGFGGPGGQGGQGGQGGPGQKGPGQKSGQGGQGGEPGAQAPKADGDFVARLFQNDKNNDGKLTKSELPEALQSIFERADTNKDGAIDRQEAGVLAERMKSRTGSQGQGTDGKRPPLEK
ncbi:MAG: hypothetical protein B9S33_03430 [Pedosphaera sp. Tous-C6FEB]|nr:MAG: hypothetical protein B9S33_03430 [Pedosphaera sp. Tous-C6FEB]